MALQRLGQGLGLEVADVAGETVGELVRQLLARDRDLLGVDHDDVVAGVPVGGLDGLVLGAQAARELGTHAAPRAAGCLHDLPAALAGLGLCGESTYPAAPG